MFRVIDYKHVSTPQLQALIKDVDVDKIIQKRKAVALRKKILEYLKNAERPEDTVSNPKYPRNWEPILPENRPPLKNKRKKKLTPKIRRVLAHKREELSANRRTWTVGYTEAGELEEISDDDFSSENDVQLIESDREVEEVPMDPKLPPVDDRHKKVTRTTPDFNHFNNFNVRDIRDLLYFPGRVARPSKIMMILRGASGSGKSHLAQLIKRKEAAMGGDVRIISINSYFEKIEDDEDDGVFSMSEIYLEQMVKMLKRPDSFYKFIIIDAENCDLNFYNRFIKVGTDKGFATFTIELHQTIEICEQQNINKKPTQQIRKEIEMLKKNRVPIGQTVLIASELYNEFYCFINPKIKTDDPIKIPDDEGKSDQPDSWRMEFEECPKVKGVPNFNWHCHKNIIDIRQILDEPVIYDNN